MNSPNTENGHFPESCYLCNNGTAHTPEPSLEGEWEKKFDEEFACECGGKKCGNVLYENCIDDLKSFIRSLLSRTRKETLNEILEEIEGMKKLENREVRKSGDWDLAIGWNACLDDLSSLIKRRITE